MGARRNMVVALLTTALACCCLASCSSGGSSGGSSSAGQPSSAAAPASTGQSTSREDIEAIIDAALATSYDSMAFSAKTETTATGVVNGQTQQQNVESTSDGELDKSSDALRMHMACMARSSTALGVTEYDMYFDGTDLMVTQGDKLYRDELSEESLQSYVDSVTAVTKKEEIDQLLDAASSYKVEEKDGEKIISITADVDKLADAGLYDESSLPEGTSIATLVASYTIDADNHFTAARLMSSTSGSPTYRVTQTYRYYDYDKATLPDWPDWQAYVAEQTGLLTDENGRLYLVDDDGQVYYVESISPDGVINFSAS